MGSDSAKWKVETVIDLQNAGLLLVEDGNHGEYRPRPDEFGASGTSFIRAADMAGGRVLFESAQKINDAAMERIRKGIGASGDVILSHKGTVGKVAFVPLDSQEFVCSPQTTFWRTLDNDKIDRRYLFSFLNSQNFKDQLYSLANETDMAGYVSLTSQRGLKVTLPPISIQRSIAHILGSLDDKIELNRRMNATLEGLAQTLFQSWFVDFDPVLDNALAAGNPIPDELTDRAAVRRQALDNGTANRAAAQHFPASFQFTEELGWIPEGWDTKTIEELAEKVAMGPFGSSIKVSTFVEEGIPVISGQHLKNTLLEDSVFNFITPDHAEKLKRSNVFRGDIIFTHAGSIGQVSLIPPESKYDRYVISQRQFYLRCDLEKTSSLYLTYFFRSHDGQHVLLANASQVGVPSLARPSSYLKSIRVINPDKTILNLFDNFIRDIHTSLSLNNHESKTLSKLRDTLLPQLISGEVRIPNAAK